MTTCIHCEGWGCARCGSTAKTHPLVVIEGADGSGKSSLAKRLAEAYGGFLFNFPQRRNHTGRIIDQLLKGAVRLTANVASVPPAVRDFDDALVLQALQTANRAESWSHLTVLRQTKPVFCDRYSHSGYAYGVADGLDPKLVMDLQQFLPKADCNILLDCAPEVALARQESRGKREFYETKGPEYFAKVRANYQHLRELREFDHVINAAQSADEVFARACAIVDGFLNRRA